MLSFVSYLVILSFVSLLGNIYSWRPEGVMRNQLISLKDTKNERSFLADESGWDIAHFLLVLQWFVYFGLVSYTYIRPNFFEELLHLEIETVLRLIICISVPAVWFFVQWGLYQWWAYLFHQEGKAAILSRIYKAIYMLAAPLALLVFLFELTGLVSPDYSWILLLLTFIIAQIVFIFSGIKIFWTGIGTLCLIFLYLCAFKIAPIILLLAKLG